MSRVLKEGKEGLGKSIQEVEQYELRDKGVSKALLEDQSG